MIATSRKSALLSLLKITRFTPRRVNIGNTVCVFTLTGTDTHTLRSLINPELTSKIISNNINLADSNNSHSPKILFLLKLLQAIEKLLNQPISNKLHLLPLSTIKSATQSATQPKIQLYFQGPLLNNHLKIKNIDTATDTRLCFFLPEIQYVINNPALKQELWQKLNAELK